MKTADYIAKRIKTEVDTVFGVQGGCIINVVDSFIKANMNIISMHHEQSAAIAADAYARFKDLGVCYGTSGPGTTNLLTGTCCSYFDSIPVLTIGGQVPTGYLTNKDRQMGFQEVNGIDIFKSVTKLSRRYSSPKDLEDCINVAKAPRRGPTFIEIPDNVQREDIDNMSFEHTVSQSNDVSLNLSRFKKPLLIIGYGAIAAKLNITVPFLYTWRTKDRLYNHPFCKGGFGITADSAGNKLIKEADAIVMLGTRIDSHQAPKWDKFAPNAFKIAVGLEFPHKDKVDQIIVSNLLSSVNISGSDWCSRVKEDRPDGPAYRWIDSLSAKANKDDIIIPDMGQIGCIAFQRWGIKQGQRLFNGMNHSPMGYSLPGSIGACIATNRRVIVIVGEGSLMMNVHDLQTISDLRLPINIFVVNNGGYGMIRQTQDDWKQFLAQGVGCNFNIPNIKKLAAAFKLKYTDKLSDEPSIFEVKMSDTKINPKWKFGEDL